MFGVERGDFISKLLLEPILPFFRAIYKDINKNIKSRKGDKELTLKNRYRSFYSLQ